MYISTEMEILDTFWINGVIDFEIFHTLFSKHIKFLRI